MDANSGDSRAWACLYHWPPRTGKSRSSKTDITLGEQAHRTPFFCQKIFLSRSVPFPRCLVKPPNREREVRSSAQVMSECPFADAHAGGQTVVAGELKMDAAIHSTAG